MYNDLEADKTLFIYNESLSKYGLNNAMFGQREYQFDIGDYLTDNIIEMRKG